MLLYPIANDSNEINIHLGLKMSQNKRNAISVTNRKAKANPIKEINHHFLGLRYGARQANKKITATKLLKITKKNLVTRR